MEEMEAGKNTEDHLTSAAAFVDGGIQDPCDDACSICLEEFSNSDPSAVTTCKHEFHLQCILEWCQRSSQCPMCWRPISLKDPASQELLEAVEQERNFRVAPARNTTIFRHPTLGDFELQHLPAGVNDADLEERIIQHLAAAAAMGRAHHVRRREIQRSRPSAQARSHYLVFPSHANDQPVSSVATPSSPLQSGNDDPPLQIPHSSAPTVQNPYSASGSNLMLSNRHGVSPMSRSSPDAAGPSDLHSISESLKSKFNAMSLKYKESFSKSTRGWKERLFSRNSSAADAGSEVRREMNAGIASVSRMMERFETGETERPSGVSVSDILTNDSGTEQGNRNNAESSRDNVFNGSTTQTTCPAGPA